MQAHTPSIKYRQEFIQKMNKKWQKKHRAEQEWLEELEDYYINKTN